MYLPFDQNEIETGEDFEKKILEYLLNLGFHAKRTGLNDFGVDIIATKGINGKMEIFNIQCKYYNKTLGNTDGISNCR